MKTILLAVCGLSPQVITETLYALHQTGRTVDAIHIITTQKGKDRILTTLLEPGGGYYFRYLKEYEQDIRKIDFGPPTIHTLKDEQDREIPDIRDEEDNERLLHLCLDLTFRFTRNPETAVYFSVAGGRKTMSSCLALAAQMYGRSQDRLFHVLVSPEFESHPDFFYPPRTSRLLELKDEKGNPYFKESRYAEVNLIHLPFVSIRERLGERYLKKPFDPATLMMSLIREDQLKLVIDLVRKKVVYRGMEADLMPAHLALYAFFALRKKECSLDVPTCARCNECFLDQEGIYTNQKKIMDLYQKLAGSRPLEEMKAGGIIDLSSDNFTMYKSKIRKEMQKNFGLYALKDLEIVSVGKRPNTRFGMGMDKGKIEIVY
ncbi:MAG: CRISPR-associated ring nuclease Csm6 [Thermodesulfobacteriota bacterium]